jgi:hypothetical protein
MKNLRASILVVSSNSGSPLLTDTATGLRLAITQDVEQIIRRIGHGPLSPDEPPEIHGCWMHCTTWA